MTSAKHTIGVIGLGSIGRRHATNLWKELKQTEVIGYDIELTDKVGWVCGDLDFLLKVSTAVVIASPTAEHCKHICQCGNKPIFIEKPIAATEDELTHLLNRKWGVIPEMVGYNLRFHPCVKKAKEWFDAGDIGDPIWANFTLGQRSSKPPYLRDGVILNWSHEIDLCLYLLGSGSVACSCTRLTDGRDDLTDITFKNDNGCHSVIHLDYTTEPEVRQTIIQGKKGAIILDLVNHSAWLRDADGEIVDTVLSRAGEDVWGATYVEEMQAFLDRLDGKTTLGATGEEGLNVLKICLEVRKQAGL